MLNLKLEMKHQQNTKFMTYKHITVVIINMNSQIILMIYLSSKFESLKVTFNLSNLVVVQTKLLNYFS